MLQNGCDNTKVEKMLERKYFLDQQSWDIYKNLCELHQTKCFSNLINAHRVCGTETAHFIQNYNEIMVKCKAQRSVVFWGIGKNTKYLFDFEDTVYNAMGYVHWPFIRNIPITVFCDRNYLDYKSGIRINNRMIPVIPPEEAKKRYKEAIYLVGTVDFYNEIKADLVKAGVEEKDIYLINIHNFEIEINEKQYFDDFWKPRKEEIIIDAGAYRGETIEKFIKWNAEMGYTKIIGIEPDEQNYRAALDVLKRKKYKNVEMMNVGLGNAVEELRFNASGNSGAHFGEDGEDIVHIETIDSIVQKRNVSLIKMDIEGLELEALKGGKESIQRCHPRLLVCLYHKLDDLFTIPQYILEMDNRYRFYIRIYSNTFMETVLYAQYVDDRL